MNEQFIPLVQANQPLSNLTPLGMLSAWQHLPMLGEPPPAQAPQSGGRNVWRLPATINEIDPGSEGNDEFPDAFGATFSASQFIPQYGIAADKDGQWLVNFDGNPYLLDGSGSLRYVPDNTQYFRHRSGSYDDGTSSSTGSWDFDFSFSPRPSAPGFVGFVNTSSGSFLGTPRPASTTYANYWSPNSSPPPDYDHAGSESLTIRVDFAYLDSLVTAWQGQPTTNQTTDFTGYSNHEINANRSDAAKPGDESVSTLKLFVSRRLPPVSEVVDGIYEHGYTAAFRAKMLLITRQNTPIVVDSGDGPEGDYFYRGGLIGGCTTGTKKRELTDPIIRNRWHDAAGLYERGSLAATAAVSPERVKTENLTAILPALPSVALDSTARATFISRDGKTYRITLIANNSSTSVVYSTDVLIVTPEVPLDFFYAAPLPGATYVFISLVEVLEGAAFVPVPIPGGGTNACGNLVASTLTAQCRILVVIAARRGERWGHAPLDPTGISTADMNEYPMHLTLRSTIDLSVGNGGLRLTKSISNDGAPPLAVGIGPSSKAPKSRTSQSGNNSSDSRDTPETQRGNAVPNNQGTILGGQENTKKNPPAKPRLSHDGYGTSITSPDTNSINADESDLSHDGYGQSIKGRPQPTPTKPKGSGVDYDLKIGNLQIGNLKIGDLKANYNLKIGELKIGNLKIGTLRANYNLEFGNLSDRSGDSGSISRGNLNGTQGGLGARSGNPGAISRNNLNGNQGGLGSRRGDNGAISRSNLKGNQGGLGTRRGDGGAISRNNLNGKQGGLRTGTLRFGSLSDGASKPGSSGGIRGSGSGGLGSGAKKVGRSSETSSTGQPKKTTVFTFVRYGQPVNGRFVLDKSNLFDPQTGQPIPTIIHKWEAVLNGENWTPELGEYNYESFGQFGPNGIFSFPSREGEIYFDRLGSPDPATSNATTQLNTYDAPAPSGNCKIFHHAPDFMGKILSKKWVEVEIPNTESLGSWHYNDGAAITETTPSGFYDLANPLPGTTIFPGRVILLP